MLLTIVSARCRRTRWLRQYSRLQEWICAQADGSPIVPDRLRKAFKTILEKAGLSRVRFHHFRHTHATILLSQNIHPKVVSERLGHSTVRITLDIYSHVLPNIQEEAARKFDEALENAAQETDREA